MVVELVGQADDVVVDVAEVDDLLVVDHRDVAVRQLVEHLSNRADRAADLDQLALEREEPLDRVAARGPDDLVLDLVDRVAEPVGEREVAVDDVVGKRPEQVIRAMTQDRATPDRRWFVARGSQSASWTLSRNPGAEDEIELGRDHAVAIGEVEEDDVDDAVGRLDLGALVAFEHVLDDQGVQVQRAPDAQGEVLASARSRSTQTPASGSREQARAGR